MNIDKKMFNLVVFIDLKKAFDTVNHDILLKKLDFYGIKGQALDLLKSYLSNRHQKCQVESFVSSEHLIKCGVPQGSILGPLLFLLYINDLPECLKNTRPRLFADDTNLTASSHSIADIQIAVNSDLENLRNSLMASRSAFSFRTQLGIPSGPLALAGFTFDNFIKTSCSVTVKPGSSLPKSVQAKKSLAKGEKSFIGERKIPLIILARCLVLVAVSFRFSSDLYTSFLELKAEFIPLNFLTSLHQSDDLQLFRCLTFAS